MNTPTSSDSTSRPSFGANVVAALGGQLACALVAMLTEICYARIAGPEARGQISLCLTVVALGVLAGGMGGEVPIVIWAAEARRKPGEWLPAILLWGLLGSSCVSALWVAAYLYWQPAFLRGITSSLALMTLTTLPAAILLAYLMAMLAGAERFRLRAGIAFADQVGALLSFLTLMLLFDSKAEAAMLGNLAGMLLGMGIIVALLRTTFRAPVRMPKATPEFRGKVAIGLRGTLGNVAAFFSYRLDVFIVNFFLGPSQVGLYALGTVVAEALWQIPQAAASALLPRTARTEASDAAQFTCLVMRQTVLISCGSALVIAAVSPMAIPLIFGARFASSVAVIWWLLPGTIALALGKVACADLAGRGRTGFTSVFAAVAMCVTVLLDLALIPRMGIQGAGLASSVAYVTDSVLLLFVLRRQLQVSWRSLLMPARAEWMSYHHGWVRYQAWWKERFGQTLSSVPAGPADD